jgi:methionyl-tRNA formyltransferase
MDQKSPVAGEKWRVLVFTNIPGGLVYTMLDELLQPLGHRIVGVVTTLGPVRRRSRDYLDVVAAVRPGVDVIVSNHPQRWAAMLAPLRPDLIISGGFPWRIPADVLALPRHGAINMHPALLPKYRGPSAIEWAFRNGERETGFTIHRLAPEFDTGPILAQAGMPISDEDDMDSLLGKIVPLVPDLMRQALERVARGELGEPQDEAQASYANLFEDDWRVIDWARPAREIHNQVRSWTGMRDTPKGAFGEIDGETLLITRTRLLPNEAANIAPPGTVLRRTDEGWVVQSGDGPIAIVAWSRPDADAATISRASSGEKDD